MGLLSRLFGSGSAPRSLLAALAETYRAEAAQAEHLRAHAERARYPQMAGALRRLADIEERHAGWLRERLLTLGAELPPIDPTPPPGNNQWPTCNSRRQTLTASPKESGMTVAVRP